ncbi:glycosyltransferase family 2 protein [[Eubacterium] hominis]|uniref:glycosyltransferase family 2 protein n=1 Tax=[Eubacterium] hominis TaxID=2764325 RepID=UPI003A4DFA2C
MNNKMISIIVPVYKVENELERCIKSLIKQTYEKIEIILVDDGSPDNCPRICDSYAKKDNRIKVIHKKNGGLSDARNYGLNEASGDYILYVDSDDYLELDACEQLAKGITSDVDFIVGAMKKVVGDKESYLRRSDILPNRVYSAKEFAIASIKNNEWFAGASFNLYNRKFLLDNELFFKVGYMFEDHQMLPRLYLAANNIIYIDYPFYNYIIREESITTSPNSPEKIKMILDIYNEWMDLIGKINDYEYQRYLYGALVKYYLYNARNKKFIGWQIKGLDFKFSFKYALNLKEKLKVIFFSIFPNLYINMKIN